MNYQQASEAGYKGGCGSNGRGKFGGPWGRGKFGRFGAGPAFGRFRQPPVNIEEQDDRYIISLFAAGLNKEQVGLTVKDDVLTIAYPGVPADATGEPTGTPEQNQPGRNYTYQEYRQGPFERQFRLNNKILTDGIAARYADGVLTVTLPKNPDTNKPAQTVSVA